MRVTRDGTRLLLDGQPYRFTGVNAYSLAADYGYPFKNAGCGPQVDLSTFYAALRPRQVVRFWAFHQMSVNVYTGAQDWHAFDRVFALAESAGVGLLPVLRNQWGDCDGRVLDAAWYAGGWHTEPGPLGQNWQRWVWDFVRRYRASPALVGWELVNEPEPQGPGAPCNWGTAAQTLRTFFDTAGGWLKRDVDPDHLLFSGALGLNQCGWTGDGWRLIHASPAIDVACIHDYSPDPADGWLTQRLVDATAVGKPLVLEETWHESWTVEQTRTKTLGSFDRGVVGVLPWRMEGGSTVRAADPCAVLMREIAESLEAPPTSWSFARCAGRLSAGRRCSRTRLVRTGREFLCHRHRP